MTLNKFASIFIISVFTILLSTSCGKNKQDVFTDNFDRSEMLKNWADNIIIPAFQSYSNSLDELKNQKNAFITDPDENTYNALVDAWLTSYKSWQHVAMFDIGKAEEIKLQLYTNTFPADITLINQSIQSQDYNLELPSNKDIQGFPALDYLLFGLGDEQQERINLLGSEHYSNYLSSVIERLSFLTTQVLSDWENGYRDEFITNNGSSGTASVDKLVNDVLFYYEKFLRAGKIGIPAGIFSGSAISSSVEAPYSNINSKMLFFEGFQAIQDFFVGRSHDGTSNRISLDDYLAYIQDQNQTANIFQNLEDQWRKANDKGQLLSNSFKEQVEMDNSKMLETYDELQKGVVIMKVDLMQALNIQVDYIDADGD